jgi:hypothetical protein
MRSSAVPRRPAFTELSDAELIKVVSLDLTSAVEG